MDLTVNSKIIAAVQVQAVQLLPILGAYELALLLGGTVHAMTDGQCRSITICDARMFAKVRDGRSVELGRAVPDGVAVVRQMQNATFVQQTLKLVLQPHQVEALEVLRDGGDLTFRARFSLRASTSASGDGDWEEQAEMNIDVPESAWVAQLNSAGASRVLLFEIRLPGSPHSKLRGPAERHLMRAQELLIEGNWRECVAECRQFAEEIGGPNLGRTLDKLVDARKAMTKAERADVLVGALKFYGDLASHSESKQGELDYSRSEAKLVLSVACSLAEFHFGALGST